MEQTQAPEGHTDEAESVRDPDENLQISDGGWGWVVCFAGFMINFTSFGMASSHGVLALGLSEYFDETLSKTTIVVSIFTGVALCVGPFVLLLMMFNASHRQVIIYGGLVSALSNVACFFAERIEVLYFTYGILSACFLGISVFAGNTIVGCYFKQKRTLAVGIASSGSGFGAFSLNYLMEQSISFYGVRGTFLLISGLVLNFVVYGALCRPLKKTKGKTLTSVQTEINLGFESDGDATEIEEETNNNNSGDSVHSGHSGSDSQTNMKSKFSSKCHSLRNIIFDPDVIKNHGIQLLLTIYAFWAVNQTILIYLPAKAVDVGLTREQGAFIMSIFGAVFAFSQILVGILADYIHIPTSYLLMSSLFGMAVSSAAMAFCHTFYLFVLCTSLFAICNGFCFALRVIFVASILGVKELHKGYSPLCLLIGLSYIIFPIIAGALLDVSQSLDVIFYFGSGSLCVACITSSGIIYIQRQKKLNE